MPAYGVQKSATACNNNDVIVLSSSITSPTSSITPQTNADNVNVQENSVVIFSSSSTPTGTITPKSDSQDVDADSEDGQAKKRQLTSKFEDHFERLVEGTLVKLICNYCKYSLSAASAAGTNHL
ncbi:hypothetical protein PTTG_28182 [Puccinia triticina 1-1 BBBD Race 1]|uniref:BED-type domain-containing protein n=1 Tax=Puccinia triticina (isolate 1-1 / race 1 (BBBD)) TaxID=630390 RepID=A0A180GDT0_PUCT1|nr:hypothetical protein PTTG_28182 [Puccinia triticina 1-1 BBBD Race 1]